MRRTTIPNSSFLIPHSRKAFIHNQWTEPPKGRTLNPEPRTLNPNALFPFPFPLIYGNMVAIDYIYNEVQE